MSGLSHERTPLTSKADNLPTSSASVVREPSFYVVPVNNSSQFSLKIKEADSHFLGDRIETNKQKYQPSLFDKLTFAWLGLSLFICFFAVTQTLQAYDVAIFPHWDYPAKSQTYFSYSQLLLTIGLLIMGRSIDSAKSIAVAILCLAICSIIFPFIAFFGKGQTWAYYTTLGLVFIQQAMLGIGLSGAFALSSVISPVLPAQVALGVAVSGVLAFALGGILSNTLSEIALIISMFCASAISIFICIAAYQIFLVQPWVTDQIVEMRKKLTHGNADKCESESTRGSSTVRVVFRCATPVLSIFLCLASLFVIYPTFCLYLRPTPSRFGPSIIGLHNVGETMGRLLISLGYCLPSWLLFPIAMIRFTFVPLFRFILGLDLNHWLRSEVSLYTIQIIQGFSMGALASSCFVVAAASVFTNPDKQLAGIITTAACNLGIPFGTLIFNTLLAYNYIPNLSAPLGEELSGPSI